MSTLNHTLTTLQHWIINPDTQTNMPEGILGHPQCYHHAYRARLIDALRANFPALYGALGEERFKHIAQHYVSQVPSIHRSIRWYGDQFVDFLKTIQPALHTAMLDIARLDWAMNASFDAHQQPTLTADYLTHLDPAQWAALIVRPQAHVQLIDLTWDIAQAWQTLSQNPDANIAKPTAKQHTLLIWRDHDLELIWQALHALEANYLKALASGTPFGVMCEQANQHNAVHGLSDFIQLFHRLVTDGIFCQPSSTD